MGLQLLRLSGPGERRQRAIARFPGKVSAQAHGYRVGQIWKGVREVSWQAFVMKNCHHFTGWPPDFRAGNCGPLLMIANGRYRLWAGACW
jgi:hypothetical protein